MSTGESRERDFPESTSNCPHSPANHGPDTLALGFAEPTRRPDSDATASAPAPDLRQVLERWASQGIAVRPDGKLLRVSVAGGRLPPEIADEIRARKPALLEYLRTYPCTSCGRQYGFRQPMRCFWCRAAAEGATPHAAAESRGSP